MRIEGASVPNNAGTQFILRQRFGTFPAAPLLRVLASNLESGSVIRFITLTDPHLRAFLRAQGLAVWRFPWRHDADLQPSRESAILMGLVTTAETHHVMSLAVWLLVYDRDKNLILESEDGNNYLWLADRVPPITRERLLAAVGGAVSQSENVPPLS